MATGKIGFYVFIARTVCAGKISLEFAQEFSSTRPSVADSSQETSGKKINLIIRIKSYAFRVSLDIFMQSPDGFYKLKNNTFNDHVDLRCYINY